MNTSTETNNLPAPEPAMSEDAVPYWDGARDGRLVLPVCDDCRTAIWFPRGFCPDCGSFAISWLDAPGTGHVYSYTVSRRGQGAYRESAPYVLAYVEVDPPAGVEGPGPRVLTNIIDCDPESVSVDLAVTAVFHATPKGNGLLRFRPV